MAKDGVKRMAGQVGRFAGQIVYSAYILSCKKKKKALKNLHAKNSSGDSLGAHFLCIFIR
jgi:hypothetical protein